jgi:hypothetical protein
MRRGMAQARDRASDAGAGTGRQGRCEHANIAAAAGSAMLVGRTARGSAAIAAHVAADRSERLAAFIAEQTTALEVCRATHEADMREALAAGERKATKPPRYSKNPWANMEPPATSVHAPPPTTTALSPDAKPSPPPLSPDAKPRPTSAIARHQAFPQDADAGERGLRCQPGGGLQTAHRPVRQNQAEAEPAGYQQ